MSQNAIPSVGTVLLRGNGAATEVFTAIAEVTQITPMGGSTETIDASDLASSWREKKPGMLDAGQLQFTVHLLPGSTDAHADLMEDWTGRVVRNFQIEFGDGSKWEIAAFISGVSPTVPAASASRSAAAPRDAAVRIQPVAFWSVIGDG